MNVIVPKNKHKSGNENIKLAADLEKLGYRAVADLQGEDAEAMYARLMSLAGQHIDRCVLYVFRCAVYFAETAQPEPD